MKQLNCQVYIANPHYCKPGYCSRKDVRVVRWAPTPMKTKVYHLCGIHRGILESNGKINLGGKTK